MAEARPTEERIAELDKKIEQIKAQKKAILQREKQAERKARTKRLIQIGADRKSTRLNSSHTAESRMPSSA